MDAEQVYCHFLGVCGCNLPFTHYKFPKDLALRSLWIKFINRQKSAKDKRSWSPNKDSVVCSEHFLDGKPTKEHPCPTVNLGYHNNIVYKSRTSNTTSKIDLTSTSPSSTKCSSSPTSQQQQQCVLVNNEKTCSNVNQDCENWLGVDDPPQQSGSYVKLVSKKEASISSSSFKTLHAKYVAKNMAWRALTKELSRLKNPTHKKLLKNDNKCLFYTNIPRVDTFYFLCKYVHQHQAELIKKQTKTRLLTFFKNRNLSHKKPVNFRKHKKLSIDDCVLLCLMKLTLGLLHEDLADRYKHNIHIF